MTKATTQIPITPARTADSSNAIRANSNCEAVEVSAGSNKLERCQAPKGGKPWQSKLLPHIDEVRELRKHRHTYNDISEILLRRHGLKIATSSIFNFVRVRERHRGPHKLPEERDSQVKAVRAISAPPAVGHSRDEASPWEILNTSDKPLLILRNKH
jgi:hypothetical protein